MFIPSRIGASVTSKSLLAILLFFACNALAQSSADLRALAEQSDLLPTNLSMSMFSDSASGQEAVGDARLFSTPFYGPQVYLLVVRLDFEETAPQLRSNRVTSNLSLRPAEQRIWAALIKLPNDHWPIDGTPEVLAPMLKSVATECDATQQVLALLDNADYSAMSDGGTLSLTAFLASWRHGEEPVLAISMNISNDGNGGGSHLTQGWYVSHSSYALEPLICTPLEAGYWSKPSYDTGGGTDASTSWRLWPGKSTAHDPAPLLELREHSAAGKPGRVIARYKWGFDRYELQPAGR